ncbi:tRNA-specific adenosine deaminase 1-like [Homarus americanus]|uniref:tRNA-specific adenosine deaminase 1-like n=1 Tax=Homarus americanus TaxID=6706 RepID=UPI001C44BC25|nr:tRNA-specific adenosine deaminase 1-like [Homarus americanus]
MKKMIHKYEKIFGDEVTKTCISKFKSLGKTGKPKENTEWTLLSCFLKEDHHSQALEVVALGTGSKCIGAKQLPARGDVIHDSHAEVIARRAFMVYLLDQVDKASKGLVSIFEEKDGKFKLKTGISFHFYASHTPCGDASIFPKQEWGECFGQNIEDTTVKNPSNNCKISNLKGEDSTNSEEIFSGIDDGEPPLKKIKTNEVSVNTINASEEENLEDSTNVCVKKTNNVEETSRKEFVKKLSTINDQHVPSESEASTERSLTRKMNTVSDIYRTGAKCIDGETPDPKMPGTDYHVTGVLRTKPGRGDPTLSLSCSDKIFKWTVLGTQGAILMLFLNAPVYVETITIGKCSYSQEAMERALIGRFEEKVKNIQLPFGFQLVTPVILHSNIDFPFSQSCVSRNASKTIKIMASPTSIIWSSSNIHGDKHEVATNGCKLGTTKKNRGTPKSWVSICRHAIFHRVLAFLCEHSEFMDSLIKQGDISYGELKCQAHDYYKAWVSLKHQVLPNWTVKPNYVKEFKA